MANDIKQKIVLDGEKEYNQALSTARRNLRTLRTEMKAETAELGANATAQEKNRVKVQNLQKQVKEQEKVVEAYRKALEEVRDKYGDNEEAIAKYEQKLNEARATLANMKNTIDSVGKSYGTMQSGAKSAAVENAALALSFDQISKAADTMSSGIQSVFTSVIDTITGAIGDLWADLMEIAEKADAYTDLAAYLGASTTEVQKWDRAMRAAGGDMSTITGLISRLKYGGKADKVAEWFGISAENYSNDLEYIEAVLQAMSEMKDEMVANGTWGDAVSEILGSRKVQEIDSVLSDWPEIVERLARYDTANGGIGLTEEDIETANQLASDVRQIREDWAALKEMAMIHLFGDLALDLTSNAQGALDALIELMNAETQEERDAAIKKFEENITAAFTRIGEAIQAAGEALDAAGKELQSSENSYVRLLGNILTGISSAMEWITTEGNLDKVLEFFRAIFDLWLVGKGASFVSTISGLAANFRTIFANRTLPTLGGGLGLGGGLALDSVSQAIADSAGGFANTFVNILGKAKWALALVVMLPVIEAIKNHLLNPPNETYDKIAREADKMNGGNGKVGFNPLWDLITGRATIGDVIEHDTRTFMHGVKMATDASESARVQEVTDRIFDELGMSRPKINWGYTIHGSGGGSARFGEAQEYPLDIPMAIRSMMPLTMVSSDWWTNNSGKYSEDLSGLPGGIKNAVRDGVSNIKVVMDGETVGRLVAPTVSQEIAKNAN